MTAFERFALDGRVAVVTGASSGLGVAFAEGLAAAGADVVLAARRTDLLEETRGKVASLGRRCVAVPADVTAEADCAAVVAAAVEQLGGVHILVNNAGINTVVPAHKESPSAFMKVVETNLLGAFQMSQAFARACIAAGHGGSVVNVSSTLGMTATDLPQAAYVSSKAALIGLTRDLAMQWTARRGIRVNALVPGLFVTGMSAHLTTNDVSHRAALSNIPMGRLGDAEELVGPLLLLVSDAGSYITGSALVVDGGWTAR